MKQKKKCSFKETNRYLPECSIEQSTPAASMKNATRHHQNQPEKAGERERKKEKGKRERMKRRRGKKRIQIIELTGEARLIPLDIYCNCSFDVPFHSICYSHKNGRCRNALEKIRLASHCLADCLSMPNTTPKNIGLLAATANRIMTNSYTPVKNKI